MALCSQRLNRFNCTGVTLRTLVRLAFPATDGNVLPISQILGGPDWIKTAQFNIQAETAPGTTVTPAEVPPFLRALLEDRFTLKAHTELRSFPAYALVIARNDRRLGSKLRPSTTDCFPPPRDMPAPAALAGRRCFSGTFRLGTINAPNITMDALARNLTQYGGADRDNRIVVDRTGLGGKYEIDLRWAADLTQPSDDPPLVTAIQEQLGLKLEPRTEQLPAIVIDHVEQPTPN